MNADHGGLSNDLADWFPPIAAAGIPVPRTLIIPVPESLLTVVDGINPRDPEFPADARYALEMIHLDLLITGTPVFIRTGELSGKHQWADTCALTDPDQLEQHLYHLYEAQCAAFGLPLPAHIILREMLNTEPLFYAFDGMPITKERRYFTTGGRVTDHHPYWPIAAVLEGNPTAIDGSVLHDADVADILSAASVETDDEIAELTALTERAAAAVTGDWSFDWLWTVDRGWVFIDAAHAERSYRMPEQDRALLSLIAMTK